MTLKVLNKSFYGSVCIPKAYCEDCRDLVFIVNARYSCCEKPFKDDFLKEKLVRVVQSENERSVISKFVKTEILELQKHRCIYCDIDLRQTHYFRNDKQKYCLMRINYDHFVPWISNGNNHKSNLYASCNLCNRIKSDKHFIDIVSAREFILNERKRKGL
jgi:hypothetical protein